MSKQIYKWKRFWRPRTDRINLPNDRYLHVTDAEREGPHDSDVVSFKSIATVPCLALLGEPGLGKTHTIEAERKAIESKTKGQSDKIFHLDLRSYGSEDRLVKDLFENSTFASWVEGDHNLHIFLDSLDECLLRINNVSTLLIDEFKSKKYPVERLNLRIACRSAVWPKSLEDGLRELWGDDSVGVYELAPLRQVDIVEAAKANGLDPDEFLFEIIRKKAVPLAIRPVTLNFLLNIYNPTAKLPSTQTELYLEGCRVLCEEPRQARRDAPLKGSLTAEQRMAVASRIAAITVFANRYAVWLGIDQGDVPNEDVTIHELCGGSEGVRGNEFEINEDTVRETLDTGLFSSRGQNRMGWSHQTYAEFLAAHYLRQRQMTLDQLMSLIIHPGEPDGKLVPQLHETSSWLAGMVPDVFQKIMKADPEVLLQSDVATFKVKDRVNLVDKLLKLYEGEKSVDFNPNIRRQYRKLAHPDLVEQLRPYVCGAEKNIIVRRVAINIAQACELQVLQDELANIALEPSQPLPIRVHAAYAIVRIGDNDTKAKLKPLATCEAGDDPEDDLKGCALQAVWPNYMTDEELFGVLTVPKKYYGGLYFEFLIYKFQPYLKRLKTHALLTALKWVERQKPRFELNDFLGEFVDAIFQRAWEHLESPGVLKAFAKAVWSQLKINNESVAGVSDPAFKIFEKNDEKRRQVLESMLPMLSSFKPDSRLPIPPYSTPLWQICQTPLVMSKDMPWMIERFQFTKLDETKLIWAQLIKEAFNWREPGQLDAIFVASRNSPVLAEAFAWILKPIVLDSPEAKKMKEDYLKRQKWHEHRKNLKPLSAERINVLLDEFESGNSAAWWRLNKEILVESDRIDSAKELEPDLTGLPGWHTADAVTRERIIDAAKKYLFEQDPKTQEWLGTNKEYEPALAGYRALRLLLK